MLKIFQLVLISICTMQTSFANEQQIKASVVTSIGLYDKQEYAQAIEEMKNALALNSSNGYIFYNLGNYLHRLDKKGSSIGALLVARTLLPRDPNIRANLKHVHNQITDKLDIHLEPSVLESLVFWKNWVSYWDLVNFSLFSLSIALILFALFWLRRNFQGIKYVSFLFGMMAFVGLFMASLSASIKRDWGAIAVERAKVYSGPNESNTILFELSEGAPYVLETRRQGFSQISLSDGKKGWIQSNAGFDYYSYKDVL